MRLGSRSSFLASAARLPYDAELEYLESTGTQWIDLGVNSTTDGFCDFDITFQCTGSGGSRLVPFGYQYGGSQRYASWAVTTSTWGVGVNNSECVFVSADTDLHTIRVRNGQFVEVDGVQTAIGTGTVRANIGMGLFVRNQSSSGLSTSSMTIVAAKVYSFKLYDSNGNLVRDGIPVRVGTVGYLYDRVSGKLFGNAGTGAFGYGSDVVPVEYIESRGTEYIDTGVANTDDLAIEVEAATANSSGNALYGVRGAAGATTVQRVIVYNNLFMVQRGRQGNGRPEVAWTAGFHVFYSSATEGRIDNTVQTGNFSIASGSADTLALFAQNVAGTVNSYLAAKIKRAKTWNNSILSRSFLPVRVGSGSTWEGAMMDTLTRRIYRNAGTGAFAYGADLPYPIGG